MSINTHDFEKQLEIIKDNTNLFYDFEQSVGAHNVSAGFAIAFANPWESARWHSCLEEALEET